MEDKVISIIIAKYLANEANTDEQNVLLEWLSEDPLHQQVFQEYCKVWQDTHCYAPDFNDNRAFEKFSDQINLQRKKTLRMYVYGIAACITCIICFATYTYLPFSQSKSNYSLVDTTSTFRSVPFGKKLTLNLPDGSTIKLNGGSSIRISNDFSSQRLVKLNGEAFFSIAKDTLRPFVVLASNTKTTVLGTAFNINCFDSTTQVTVASGKVLVQNDASQAFLLPNQQAILKSNSNKIVTHKVDVENIIAWNKNILLFNNNTLEEAAVILEQWYGASIIIDKSLLRKRISGKFQDESLRNVLEAISYSIQAHYTIEEKTIKIY